MKKAAPISVLISTYDGETCPRLERALASIRDQTLTPAEVVLVIDGPVDAAQEEVIAQFSSEIHFLSSLVLVRLEKNSGLANALNAGLQHCTSTWVARMDSDDVSSHRRLEIQWQYLQEHSDVDVLASWHRECGPEGTPLGRVKRIPEHHDKIVRCLRWRNVISHPTVVMRRQLLASSGGYSTRFKLQEDYELYGRLAVNGARFAACQVSLVDVTADRNQRIRRGGTSYLIDSEWPTRWCMYKSHFLSLPLFIFSTVVRTSFVLSPSSAKWFFYGLVRSKDRPLKIGQRNSLAANSPSDFPATQNEISLQSISSHRNLRS